MAQPQPRRVTYVPALDGMRGISLPGTIYTHFQIFLGFLPTAPWWVHKAGPFTLNIEMFFVLSGALITSLLVSEHQRTGTVALDKFYLRRSRRLGPALIAVVPLLLISQYLISGGGTSPLGESPWKTAVLILLFVGNWQLATGGNIGWLGPAWTLGIEEQFYLTWPTALRAVLRRNWTRRELLLGFWIVIVLSAGISAVLTHHYAPTRAIYMTPAQVGPILLGCALGYSLTTNPDSSFARLLRFKTTALAGLAGMVAISVLLYTHLAFLIGGGYVLYGMASCLLIGHCLAVADRPSVVSKVLGWKPFVVIGQVSYEAYLVHCIVILAVLRAAPNMPVSDMIVLDLVLIAVISGIFYYFIEQPIRRYGWKAAFRRSERPVRVVAPKVRPTRSLAGMLPGLAATMVVVVLAVLAVNTATHGPNIKPVDAAGGAATIAGNSGAVGATTSLGRPHGSGSTQSGSSTTQGPTTGSGSTGAAGSPQQGSGSGVAPTVLGLPRITSLMPAAGSILGGSVVSIHGVNFTRDATVWFGGVQLKNVEFVSGHLLRATAPPASIPASLTSVPTHGHDLQVAVVVKTAAGQSKVAPGAEFTYL